jgi:hypothetical protein
VDPKGLEAGEVQLSKGTVGTAVAQAKEFGKDKYERFLKVIKDTLFIDLSNAGELNKYKDKTWIIRLKGEKNEWQGGYLGIVQAKAKIGCPPGSIIQVVRGSVLYKKTGEDDKRQPIEFVEGWTVDGEGKAKAVDPHGFAINTEGFDRIAFAVTVTVGVGLYDNELITGERGDAKSVKGYYDHFQPGDPAKVDWLGPTKKYQVSVEAESDGTWKVVDQSIGLDKSGNGNTALEG